MISIAIAGCAHIHTPGFVKMIKARPQEVRVRRVWDHDQARGSKTAIEFGPDTAVASDVYDVWNDPQIQAVVICCETDRHEALVKQATDARKDIFVEKPLGLGAKDAFAMADAIERSGVRFQTGYMSRGWPPILFLREHVNKGSFGKITRARGSNCHSGALGGWFDTEWRWMADVKQAGCGAFGDLGTHSLDILLWLFGEVESVVATLDNGTARYPGCDETGEGILRFKNGVIGTIAAAWDDVSNPLQYLISGTEGCAAIINEELYFTCKKLGFDGKSPITSTQMPKGWPHAFELFLDAVAGKDVPLVGAREAAYRSAVMEAMYQSASRKAWVSPTI